MTKPDRQLSPDEQFYIGVKRISAQPATKDGKDGYTVYYPDGYVSWSPKDVFEAAYLPIGRDGSKITPGAVELFMGEVEAKKLDEKTTIVSAATLTGFRQHEVSSCVDPANYNHQIGIEIATERIKDTLWKCLGFVLQWSKNGLK